MEPKATNLAALLLNNGQDPLNGQQEQNFRLWALMNNVPMSNDYNMRGFYQSLTLPGSRSSGVNPNDGQMHYPDTFKLPNHPTFSTESGYFDPNTMPNTPTWTGGQISNTPAESWTLRRPNGEIVAGEAPWYAGGVYKRK